MTTKKFSIQNNQYRFPYHYIPNFELNSPSISRYLQWGWEYLAYMTYTAQKITDLPTKSHLDIGCGDGFLINSLPSKIQNKLGIDLSEEAINFAKCFSTNKNHFQCQDVDQIKEKYDSISLIEVLEHIPDQEVVNFFNNCIKTLNKNGYLVISVPSTDQRLHPKHYRHYNEEMLNKLVPSSEFEKVEITRLFNPDPVLKLILRLGCNKFITINWKPYRKLCWKLTLKKQKNKSKGYHVFGIWKKISD